MLILFLTLSALLSQAAITYSKIGTINDARSEVYTAFEALLEAYDAGGDISKLTDRLIVVVTAGMVMSSSTYAAHLTVHSNPF